MNTATPGGESTPQAQQHLTPGLALARHLHGPAYLALVVDGSYWEAKGAGRRQLRAGDVAVHGLYSAHCNQVGAAGAVVLNLAVQGPLEDAYSRIDDVDSLVRAAAQQGLEAGALTGASPQALRRRSSADKTAGRGAAIVAA